ncbi:MAG: phosphoglycerate dehydrogenase [Clostridiales bacterium]|nr:phosphoglycerate dehydrogenase [Clostridiales bacterium]
MFDILTLNKISEAGLNQYDKTKYNYGTEVKSPDAIMVRSASMHEMELDAKTVAIARAGAGVNNIPVDACSDKGVVVFNTPGANANAVKELVICGLLLASRKVVPAIDWCKTLKGEGDAVGKLVEKGKSAFAGPEIKGKKLGVIGLGAIGVLVANAANSLGMEVYGYDPFLSVESAWSLSRSIKHATDLSEIYAECDYITLHVPLTPDTKGLINKETIASMKDGVRILNFARGDLVNSADMVEALKSGKISSYVTDFPSDEVIGQEGVIAIPHLGASTPESEDNCAFMAANELIDYLERGSIKNSVNMPTVELGNINCVRICVVHKNVPNMINQAVAAVTSAGINIDNMVNKSRNAYAYTAIDADSDVNDDIIKAIEAVDGVLRVRVIRK